MESDGKNILVGLYSGKIYCITDNGANWSLFYDANTYSDRLILAIKGQNIFAGTIENGVYLSTDYGKSWKQVNRGLRSKYIYCLKISGNEIYAGFYSTGVFKGSLSDFGLSAEEAPIISTNEISIYPNPDTSLLSIRLGSEEQVTSQIKILDVCGRQVAESTIPAGAKDLNLDIENLPQGIYLLSLVAGNRVQTERFAVIR